MSLAAGFTMIKIKVSSYFEGSKVMAKVIKALEKAIKIEAEEILKEVNNNHVPFDDGDLMGSGDTDIEASISKGVVGSVYYDTPYAVRLHEHPEYEFQNGRKGKYLEDEIRLRAKEAQKRLQKALKEALK